MEVTHEASELAVKTAATDFCVHYAS
jgi:hypothetical protein